MEKIPSMLFNPFQLASQEFTLAIRQRNAHPSNLFMEKIPSMLFNPFQLASQEFTLAIRHHGRQPPCSNYSPWPFVTMFKLFIVNIQHRFSPIALCPPGSSIPTFFFQMAAAKKRVVVVGGGIAGAHTVKALENYADVVLIDPKEYFEIPWASLRCIVEPTFAERSIFLHKEYLKTAKLITDTVTGSTDETVETTSGERIPYEYLVLATGSAYEGPQTKAQKLKQYEADHKKVKDAGTILIIGGGPTGVELAGEIAVDFPEKKVILVHGGSRLIEFLGPKASRKALDWLKHKNVDVLLEERIDLQSLSEHSASYTTSSGKIITADCHFVCVGRRVASSWLKESPFAESIDEQGRVKVDENLRIEGKLNVFAAGDIVNVKEPKQGFFAQKHAEVIAENIKKLSKNPNHNKLSTYKGGPAFGIVSLGRSSAVAQLPFGTLSGRLPGMIKSKDLFVGKTRKGLGVKS